jgi:hypothetical protein
MQRVFNLANQAIWSLQSETEYKVQKQQSEVALCCSVALAMAKWYALSKDSAHHSFHFKHYWPSSASADTYLLPLAINAVCWPLHVKTVGSLEKAHCLEAIHDYLLWNTNQSWDQHEIVQQNPDSFICRFFQLGQWTRVTCKQQLANLVAVQHDILHWVTEAWLLACEGNFYLFTYYGHNLVYLHQSFHKLKHLFRIWHQAHLSYSRLLCKYLIHISYNFMHVSWHISSYESWYAFKRDI